MGITTVYVTHDQVEAMTLGDRIVVLNQGRIQQIGTPAEIYQNPVNRMVATFRHTIHEYHPCYLPRWSILD